MRKIHPPEVAKVRGNGLRVARNKNTGNHQSRQRRYLGNGKQVLHGRAQLESKGIQHREKDHNHNAAKVLRVQANIHVAQHHGANGNRRNVSNVHKIQLSAATDGKKYPRNLPNATPTAATVPVWMTRNKVHP